MAKALDVQYYFANPDHSWKRRLNTIQGVLEAITGNNQVMLPFRFELVRLLMHVGKRQVAPQQ